MGIFWDLLQEQELKKQQDQTDSLEDQVKLLREELNHTKTILAKTLHALEEHVGKDIDGDGKTG